MSKFLYHLPCPGCGSKDNLGVWDDGHKFCFGCGYYEKAAIELFKAPKKADGKTRGPVQLPADCSPLFPEPVNTWLNKYGITYKEQVDNGFQWSQNRQLLIMPVRDYKNNLLMWQGRYFGPNTEHPKYITEGDKESVIDLVGDGNPEHVVLVEDKLSAIKVGRMIPAITLYGSVISDTLLGRLATFVKVLTIWLDYDKIQYAHTAMQRAGPLFDEVNVVTATKDPKCYTQSEIRYKLQGS